MPANQSAQSKATQGEVALEAASTSVPALRVVMSEPPIGISESDVLVPPAAQKVVSSPAAPSPGTGLATGHGQRHALMEKHHLEQLSKWGRAVQQAKRASKTGKLVVDCSTVLFVQELLGTAAPEVAPEDAPAGVPGTGDQAMAASTSPEAC